MSSIKFRSKCLTLCDDGINEMAAADVIVVGTGPGGASVAKALAESGQSVLILEWGGAQPLRGEFSQMAAVAAIPGKGAFVHADGSLLMRAITAGGTSAINFATATLPPYELFTKYGINLEEMAEALRGQLPMNTLPDELVGPMATRIESSARQLGHHWHRLEKYIHQDKCRSACHRCTYGCPFDAKWSAREFVEEASRNGARLLIGSKVVRVLHSNGRAEGVEVVRDGVRSKLYANKVVLAAGGIGSPRILQQSGFTQAGRNYFVDPVIAVMGSVDDLNADTAGREVPMAAGMSLPEQGVTLADLTLPRPLFQAFSAQVGRVDRLLAHRKTLTIMVKVKDDLGGKIGPKWMNKSLTESDRGRLEYGTNLAQEILRNTGAEHVFNSHHFAAHPGGGAKIGDLVDENLQTQIAGLYVCDASVIPEPWGLAPSFTLMCLGLRLANHLR